MTRLRGTDPVAEYPGVGRRKQQDNFYIVTRCGSLGGAAWKSARQGRLVGPEEQNPNELSMRRFDRLWKILTSRSLTAMGRVDVLRVVSMRRDQNDRSYAIRLPVGEVFLEGKNAAIDFQVFAQVLLDEIYGELRPKDQVVIDVGAHKGYFAAYALMAGARAVFCYEPELTNFTCLSRFAETARFHGKTIQVFLAAVSDTDGELALYASSESWSHTIVPSQDQHYAGIVQVRSCSLANVLSCATRAFPAQDIVVKIDAEGAECPLLLNTPPESFAPVKEIVFESHSFASCNLQDIVFRMQKLGFGYVPSQKEPDVHYLAIDNNRG